MMNIELMPVTEMCPEESGVKVLVIMKTGDILIASYMADENGDYWVASNDVEEVYFPTDSVLAWSELHIEI